MHRKMVLIIASSQNKKNYCGLSTTGGMRRRGLGIGFRASRRRRLGPHWVRGPGETESQAHLTAGSSESEIGCQ